MQYPPVLKQAVVDIANIIIAVAVEPVIMRVPAIIVTEFFVSPAMQAPLTAETGFGGGDHKLA